MNKFLKDIFFLKHIRNFLHKIFKKEKPIVWEFIEVNSKFELKDKLITDNQVLIYKKGRRKFCSVRCPKCNEHNIELNLLENDNFQHWIISGPSNFTVFPSIDYKTSECSAHYWITDGKVVWAAD